MQFFVLSALTSKEHTQTLLEPYSHKLLENPIILDTDTFSAKHLDFGDDEFAFFLDLAQPNNLSIIHNSYPKTQPLCINFLDGKTRHRRLYGGGKNQDLAKAIGLNKYKNLTILDTTAGLASDAFVLASIGATVTLLERNPIAYLLVNTAIEKVKKAFKNSNGNDLNESDFSENELASKDEINDVHDIITRMTLLNINSIDYLNELCSEDQEKPDVIYIDPMFPEKKKSAAVKKSMQFFQSIIGDDLDANELLRSAINKANKRIVVKRPINAQCLAKGQIKPSYQIKGKSVRYDIYV